MTTHIPSRLKNQAMTPNRYGAVELQSYIRTSTVRGFWGSMSLLVLLFVGYSVFALANHLSLRSAPIINSTKIMTLPPPPATEVVQPPPPALPNAPLARAGTPIPVPDEALADLPDFANVDEIFHAKLNGGNGLDDGFPALVSDITVEVREEEEPDPREFYPIEKEPYVDIKDLQKKVVYPETAKRAGIEGRVSIRVLIAKTGVPKKYIIWQSDSELLNESAAKAVMGSVFTPAIQNNRPVECWVSIPIVFRLR